MSAILGVNVSSLCFHWYFWIILPNSNHRRCIGNCQFSCLLHLCVRSMVRSIILNFFKITKLFCAAQVEIVGL